MSDCRRVDIYDDEGAYYLAPKDGTHALMLWEEYQRWVARVQKANEILDEGVRIDSKNRDEIDRLHAEVERLTETMLTRQGGDRVLERHLRSQIITDEQIDEAWVLAKEIIPEEREFVLPVFAAIGIVECPECGGLGEFPDRVQAWDIPGAPVPECEACHGHGWVREERGDDNSD